MLNYANNCTNSSININNSINININNSYTSHLANIKFIKFCPE